MLTWLLSLLNLAVLITVVFFAYESRREGELKAWKIGMGAAGFCFFLGLAILFPNEIVPKNHLRDALS